MTAQPFGLNTPTVFLFLYLVMYPVYVRTKDPELAFKVGVAACFLSGVIEAAGAFVGETLQRVIPRSALLATLAGAALAYIALLPTLDLFARPVVGLVPLGLILLGYFARVRLPLNLPAGLVAVVVGSALAWATGVMDAGRHRVPPRRAWASTSPTPRCAPSSTACPRCGRSWPRSPPWR